MPCWSKFPIGTSTDERAQSPFPFIVGCGRSGTTLLRLMLDAHPALAIPPETNFFHVAAHECQGTQHPEAAFLRVLTSQQWWPHLHLDIDQVQAEIRTREDFDLGHALRSFFRVYARKFGKPRYGEKTPTNMLRMDFIAKLLPEARFIHIIRDGRDVFLSTKDLWFGPNSIEEAGTWWADNIAIARAQVPRLGYYLEILYEELVAKPELTLRRLCDYLDLPWDPAVLNYHQKADERLEEMKDRVTRTGQNVSAEQMRSLFTLVRKEPQTSRIGRWRTELTHTQIEVFERQAGTTLQEFGYPILTPVHSFAAPVPKPKAGIWQRTVGRLPVIGRRWKKAC